MNRHTLNIINFQSSKKWLFTLLWLLVSFSVFSQVKFTATINNNASGGNIKISFTLNSNGNSFRPPNLSSFNILSGPNKSSSMQFMNGNMSRSTIYSYILSPKKTGNFTIGAASIKVEGKTYKSNPVAINIVNGNKNNRTNNNQNNKNKQKSNVAKNKNAYIKLYTNKNKAYVGESIIVTYKLYFKVAIADNSVSTNPTFNGFWSEDVKVDLQTRQENINGVIYKTAILKKTILFPQRSGDLKIDPLAMNLVIQVADNRGGRSVFDQFFGRVRNEKVTVKSNSTKIKVSPLPSTSKPSSFSGNVGQFKMSASIDKNKVKANEAINLKVTIGGAGNIKMLDAPKIKFPADFEVYDPKTSDKVSVTIGGVTGKREFEYLLIPRYGGKYTIDPIKFSYFNTKDKTYHTETSLPFEITVDSDGTSNGGVQANVVSKNDVKILGKDIRFIKTGTSNLRDKNKHFYGSGLFYILLLLPLLLFGGIYFTNKKIVSYNSNTIHLKGKKATKIATKRLSEAKKIMNSDSKAFYEEVFKATYGYISDKLNINIAELNKDNIKDNLIRRNVNQGTINSLIDTLSLCEMARFAPVNNITTEEVYQKSVTIISKLEEEINKKG